MDILTDCHHSMSIFRLFDCCLCVYHILQCVRQQRIINGICPPLRRWKHKWRHLEMKLIFLSYIYQIFSCFLGWKDFFLANKKVHTNKIMYFKHLNWTLLSSGKRRMTLNITYPMAEALKYCLKSVLLLLLRGTFIICQNYSAWFRPDGAEMRSLFTD